MRLGVRVTAVSSGTMRLHLDCLLLVLRPALRPAACLASCGMPCGLQRCGNQIRPADIALVPPRPQVERDTIALTNSSGEKEQLPYGVCVWSTGRHAKSGC